MNTKTLLCCSALLLSPLLAPAAARAQATSPAAPAATGTSQVTRATLANGLKVVVVRNTLAPVVTVEMNILAGGNETPDGFPGTAHALEHMAFRGCTGMSADQTSAIYARLGGDNNADTQQIITQFYATIPATDLEVGLRAQAACLRGIDNSDAEWNQERGAIEQEVSRDLSNPTYKFITRLNADLFTGTPYAHDPLGTRPSFDATNGQVLRDFYNKWYVPSNGILVIVGDVNPADTMARVKALFADIPNRALPARPTVTLQPVKAESFTLDSNLPYTLAFLGYRLPGTDSPDYAAAQVLADVLSSQRGNLYALVPAGKALAAQFGVAETYPKASVGYGVVAVPATTDPAAAVREMASVLAAYANGGVPEDLVTAAIRAEVSQAEFQRNSIPGLANVWSNALAAEGRTSPDEDLAAIRKVTVADVNRVAKQYLTVGAVTAVLKPVPSGEAVAQNGFGGGEKLTQPPTKPVVLPEWAVGPLSTLRAPSAMVLPSDVRLPNGIRLIVKTDRTSPTVTVTGQIDHNEDLESPAGQEGVADLLQELYGYGTKTLDRIAFQKALDDIGAEESAGYRFSLKVLKDQFAQGVALLADNELHPALPPDAFPIVQQQAAQFAAGNLVSPSYRTTKAIEEGLLPPKDPSLRESTPKSIGALTLDQVKTYFARTVRPDLTTIVIIGDITPAEARTVVEKSFGAWASSGPKPETTLAAVPPNKASAAHVADPQQLQDSVVLSEELALNRFSPDYYAMQLGTNVLSGGFYASRLYHDLRQVAGYVYTVDASLRATKTRSTYTVDYGSDPDKVSKARALVENDLNRMRTEPVSPDELTLAKSLLLRQLTLSESSEETVAAVLLARAELGLPLNERDNAARQYLALNADQVRDAFARVLRTPDLVQVVRGPDPK